MEIHSFNWIGTPQSLATGNILWHCTPPSPLSCDTDCAKKKQIEKKSAAHKPENCIYSSKFHSERDGLSKCWRTGNESGLKVQLFKNAAVWKCANHMCSSWAWHGVFFYQTDTPAFLSLVVNTDVYRETLSGRHGCSVQGPCWALATVSLLPVLASVCVRVHECVRQSWLCVTSRACCLLSIESDPTTTSAAMHSNTLVLYLSSYMLSGSDSACVVSDQSEMMIWQCHTVADMLWYCACILSLLWMNSD